MPAETQDAVNWALQQTYIDGLGDTQQVTKDVPYAVVDKVREYFNTHKIVYSSFSFEDLQPHF